MVICGFGGCFPRNLIFFVVLVLSSVILIKSLTNKRLYFLSIIFIFGLLALQITSSNIVNLTELTNDQIRVRDTRLNEYPPINIPIAYWMEAKPVTIALTRIRQNLFEQLDPNLYFFAGHPRERVGGAEFEHFPYFLFPFFLAGIVVASKKHKFLIGVTLAVILITSLFGINNKAGNFALFPLLVVFIYLGLVEGIVSISGFKYKNAVFGASLLIYILILIQTIMYEA